MHRKKIVVLGVTGSIGSSTLSIIRKYPDHFELVGISYHENFDLAISIQSEFNVKNVCCTSTDKFFEHQNKWSSLGVDIVQDVRNLLDCDYTLALNAVVGAAGLQTTFKVLSDGKTLLLANKESLVMGGEWLLKVAVKNGARIMPVDSEHNSVYRLLANRSDYKKVILTASGGAIRDFPLEAVPSLTPNQVLNHPIWNMGAKITVDSATMVNKALEIIEAHFLFNIPYERLDALLHPESYVHAIVENMDTTTFYHVYKPDMTYSIAYCLFYPDPSPEILTNTTLLEMPDLKFYSIDDKRYPAFKTGVDAGKAGGNYPLIFNAANEVGVRAFLDGKILFGDISKLIVIALDSVKRNNRSSENMEELMELDSITRNFAAQIINERFI